MNASRGGLALALALAAATARGEDGVRATAVLHARFTDLESPPSGAILYDVATRTFALERYLVPRGLDRYGSTFASLALDGRASDGDLTFRLALDTGELRRRRAPLLAPVCLSTLSPTGLDAAGGRECSAPLRVLSLEETRLGAPELTANGRPFREELERTLLVREAFAGYALGRAGFAVVRAGRKRITVGDGLVYDDYATGAEVALDVGAVGPPLDLALALFQPTRDLPRTVGGISPMIAVRADYLPSLFERAGVFAAAHRDRTGSIAEATRGAILEREVVALTQAELDPAQRRGATRSLALTLAEPLESDASLGWIGTSGSLAPLAGQRLEWTLALVGGTLRSVSTASGAVLTRDVAIRGRALSLRYDVDLGDRVTLGGFFLGLSGGTMPAGAPRAPADASTGKYGGFVGVAPFVTTTNLFFGGGLSETFAARQVSTPGVNGHGVLAPGLALDWDPSDEVGVETRVARLWSDVAGPYRGRVYGTEVDVVGTWALRTWLLVGVELDALWPGDFYGGSDTVYKTVLAVDVVTP